ncbi:MAG: hypothetical protein D6747_07350, partial [Chlorobiota bacterium]
RSRLDSGDIPCVFSVQKVGYAVWGRAVCCLPHANAKYSIAPNWCKQIFFTPQEKNGRIARTRLHVLRCALLTFARDPSPALPDQEAYQEIPR